MSTKPPRPNLLPGDRVVRIESLVFRSASPKLARELNRGVVTGVWWGRWADGSLDIATDGEAGKWWVAVDRVGGGTEETPADNWTRPDAISELAALA